MARAREVAEGVFRSEGGRSQQPPLSLASNPLMAASLVNHVQAMSLQGAIASNVARAVNPQYLGVRQCLGVWRALGADPVLLRAIQVGVRAPLSLVPRSQDREIKIQDIEIVKACVQDYLEQGAVMPLGQAQASQTKYWVPVVPRAKKDSDKQRLITDLRLLNVCTSSRLHKTQSWPQVFQLLQDHNLSWAVKIDLKNWFHHLGVHQSTRSWLLFKVGKDAFQVMAMPFGWSMSPWWANKLS